mmetsp:Transcript_10629/g.17254  ORF Transcript_10629/g.17254 Transcript_10629/m.17254 type:complete len:517 (+) Transcript_10629:92-1642(+)
MLMSSTVSGSNAPISKSSGLNHLMGLGTASIGAEGAIRNWLKGELARTGGGSTRKTAGVFPFMQQRFVVQGIKRDGQSLQQVKINIAREDVSLLCPKLRLASNSHRQSRMRRSLTKILRMRSSKEKAAYLQGSKNLAHDNNNENQKQTGMNAAHSKTSLDGGSIGMKRKMANTALNGKDRRNDEKGGNNSSSKRARRSPAEDFVDSVVAYDYFDNTSKKNCNYDPSQVSSFSSFITSKVSSSSSTLIEIPSPKSFQRSLEQSTEFQSPVGNNAICRSPGTARLPSSTVLFTDSMDSSSSSLIDLDTCPGEKETGETTTAQETNDEKGNESDGDILNNILGGPLSWSFTVGEKNSNNIQGTKTNQNLYLDNLPRPQPKLRLTTTTKKRTSPHTTPSHHLTGLLMKPDSSSDPAANNSSSIRRALKDENSDLCVPLSVSEVERKEHKSKRKERKRLGRRRIFIEKRGKNVKDAGNNGGLITLTEALRDRPITEFNGREDGDYPAMECTQFPYTFTFKL